MTTQSEPCTMVWNGAVSTREQETCFQVDIPYFAHQQLNIARYPHLGLGLPVGQPRRAKTPEELDEVTESDLGVQNDLDEIEDDVDNISTKAAEARTKKRQATTALDKNSYKKLKVVGGRPAMAKKISADLDSDDEIIVRMKDAKFLERDIAEYLAAQGRINYNHKSIGSRWARLKKKLVERNDQLLDDDLTDWHDGDDDVLQEAISKADDAVSKAKAAIDAKKWQWVAQHMKTVKPVTNFSQFACKDRFEAFQAGTAKPTPESVVNPDEAILRRIQSRKDKQQKIEEDVRGFKSGLGESGDHAITAANLQGNRWTSKMDGCARLK